MSQFIHNYPVELTEPKTARQTQALFLTQDNMADRIQATVTNGGDPVTLGSISGKVMLGDGTTVDIVTGGKSGNVAYIDLPQAAYAVPGVIVITIKETVSSTVTSLLQVVGTVKKSTTGTEVQPGTPVPSMSEQLANILQAAVRTDVTQSFSTSEKSLARSNISAVTASVDGTTLVIS